MSKNKIILMEYVWATLAIVTLILFIYETFKTSFAHSYIMLILSAVSALMYLWRKSLRKKEEKEEE